MRSLLTPPSSHLAQNISAFPFLRLPPEIRNRIYFFVFSNLRLFIIPLPHCGRMVYECYVLRVGCTLSPRRRIEFTNDIALVRTCRQIYSETHLLLFRYARYHIRPRYGDSDFAEWMGVLDQIMQAFVWGALNEEQKTYVTKTGLYKHAASDVAGKP